MLLYVHFIASQIYESIWIVFVCCAALRMNIYLYIIKWKLFCINLNVPLIVNIIWFAKMCTGYSVPTKFKMLCICQFASVSFSLFSSSSFCECCREMSTYNVLTIQLYIYIQSTVIFYYCFDVVLNIAELVCVISWIYLKIWKKESQIQIHTNKILNETKKNGEKRIVLYYAFSIGPQIQRTLLIKSDEQHFFEFS